LALDLGKKRIGMAISEGGTALGLPTLNTRNKRADLAELIRVVRERSVELLLIGYPLNMNGEPGAQADWVRGYAALLEREMGLPVKLWDERLTSAEASRLLRDSDVRPDRKSGTVDRMAAVLLLQSYLDSLRYAQ
jgi:putative Holliday junction resolvase